MRAMNQGAGLPLTRGVKWLLIANVSIWLVFQVLAEGFGGLHVTGFLGLIPIKLVDGFYIWQLVTYMFLHALDVTHILFNMLMLWWLGSELEQRWGTKFFLTYYFVTGIGAGLLYVIGLWIYAIASGKIVSLGIPVIGASGAIFGLMLAYGILFGERTVHFMMMFPMQAKYFVLILGAIQVVSLLTTGVRGGEVAYLAHLGGLVSGFLYLRGRAWWNQRGAPGKARRNLRLVVDNDKSDKAQGNGPKYWN